MKPYLTGIPTSIGGGAVGSAADLLIEHGYSLGRLVILLAGLVLVLAVMVPLTVLWMRDSRAIRRVDTFAALADDGQQR